MEGWPKSPSFTFPRFPAKGGEGAGMDAAVQWAADAASQLVPIWAAVLIGLLLGWSWRPRWVHVALLALRRPRLLFSGSFPPPGFGARRVWFAITALSALPAARALWYLLRLRAQERRASRQQKEAEAAADVLSESSEVLTDNLNDGPSGDTIVTRDDIMFFCNIVEERARGVGEWQRILDKDSSTVLFEAWRRDPADGGPTQYVSRTLYENASVAMLRDFFWDDEFRLQTQWDNMLEKYSLLHQCNRTGAQIVHWVRRFPMFCAPRDYVIGRRQWTAPNQTYYCITKSTTHPDAPPPQPKTPRRVTNYFSSWMLRPVAGRDGTPNTAVECLLVHAEDMLIPRHIAKMGVRTGMWGAVQKMEPGLKEYKKKWREHGNTPLVASLNRHASQVTTEIKAGRLPARVLTSVQEINVPLAESVISANEAEAPTPREDDIDDITNMNRTRKSRHNNRKGPKLVNVIGAAGGLLVGAAALGLQIGVAAIVVHKVATSVQKQRQRHRAQRLRAGVPQRRRVANNNNNSNGFLKRLPSNIGAMMQRSQWWQFLQWQVLLPAVVKRIFPKHAARVDSVASAISPVPNMAATPVVMTPTALPVSTVPTVAAPGMQPNMMGNMQPNMMPNMMGNMNTCARTRPAANGGAPVMPRNNFEYDSSW